MKTRFILLSMALAAIAMSCTDNLSDQPEWDNGVMATTPGYEDADATRVAFSNGFANFYWSNGDCIGVCRSSASSNGTAAFTLLKGGGTVGNFINDSFSLIPQADYYAFYPFTTGVTSSAFPIALEGQTQPANGGTNHIGQFNYMSAKFTTDDNGKSSFTFENIGTIIQVHFEAEDEDVYKGLTITSSGTPFIVGARYNLTDDTFVSTNSKKTMSISFGEGMHVYNGESIVVSAVILPCDMSESTLTFSVRNANGVVKEFSLAGFAFSRGKLYHFYEDVHKDNPPYGGCPDGNHPHAIDLGLPSGTLWSCMNLGATLSAEFGVSFSWGQVACVEKNNSNWGNYEFMDESYNNEKGISKYQIADDNTDGIWYNEAGSFVGDNKITLELIDDAARQNYGGSWRIPTRKDFEELVNYTYIVGSWNYNGTSGKNGYVVYKKKSNGQYSIWDTHIYIPFGYSNYSSTADRYWTSSLGSKTHLAYHMQFMYSSSCILDASSRITKHPIRPVCSKKE